MTAERRARDDFARQHGWLEPEPLFLDDDTEADALRGLEIPRGETEHDA